MTQDQNKVIAMPVYDDVDMLDVTGPYEMFGWAKITVDLLAERPGKVTFRNGFSFEVCKGFADARDRYDAVWVPGGDPKALNRLINDPKRTYLGFLLTLAERTRMVCSVCEGAMLLAAAPLLDGYCATTHWQFVACFAKHFPKVKVADGFPRYVLDRDRLTGGGISSGLDEALMLIQLLRGTAVAQDVQRTTQYYPDPPVRSTIAPVTYCPLDDA